MKRLIALTIAACALAGAAHAQDIVRGGDPKSAIASVVTVPAGYDTIYVSGMTPPVIDDKATGVARFGDTKTQTLGVLGRIEAALKSQGATMADVVMMRVLLVGDPAKEGKMDFMGMMEGYRTYFGTAAQPNKPARITSQITGLVADGMLVEIEVQAAKKK
ncbi:enamine deaminase RidA (YjgF/YER057c/UK114 family) [Caulobacter sp. BE264]|uniref:RidA family protein n=1 Tax=Caulobacter sp. BE264 TaxID=2817724 RepID=UPI0028628889|nr:RidA family protein [Caulobacter sp. BE264]MDR7229027.1 enamine deaminase RidA (YjgF/YER057c/UK114 family) [Caulobacter sp. BE264]